MAKILICTGIYPPLVGGPAQYARNLRDEFTKQGHKVTLITYGLERKLPTGIRHELFFWRAFFHMIRGFDFIIALDTFSVGFPAAVAARILRKKIIIRTGGDFLWESYVERTGDLVLFKNFYRTSLQKLNFKERLIYVCTERTFRYASAIIFSTDWQRQIFAKDYTLSKRKTFVVENFYGSKIESFEPKKKVFIAGTRPLKWKNIPRLKEAFRRAKSKDPSIELDLSTAPYESFLLNIQRGYAVILASLGDISPNMILDAVRSSKPFILTKENGLRDKLGDIGIYIDPENIDEIAEKILFLAQKENYEAYKRKIENFSLAHSWKEICDEFLAIAEHA